VHLQFGKMEKDVFRYDDAVCKGARYSFPCRIRLIVRCSPCPPLCRLLCVVHVCVAAWMCNTRCPSCKHSRSRSQDWTPSCCATEGQGCGASLRWTPYVCLRTPSFNPFLRFQMLVNPLLADPFRFAALFSLGLLQPCSFATTFPLPVASNALCKCRWLYTRPRRVSRAAVCFLGGNCVLLVVLHFT
jgi:hypothetical protein